MALQVAIADAKSRSWSELLEGLNRDPWGRPYKMVLGKLRPWVPPLTETLDPGFVGDVVNTLFPRVQDNLSSPPVIPSSPIIWDDELGVTEQELDRAVKRLRARNTAPGPDGIPGRAWVLALSAGLGDRLRRLFDGCLRIGVFPKEWKEAKLVLLKKDGRPVDSPSAYRPICLLDEAGKLFERIIADRLCTHLWQVGPDLSNDQFGFRQARSTVDAILRVRSLSDQVVSQGGKMLAVSLDIVNAFNSLPWRAIGEALVFHRVPPYLQRIVGAYLRDRWVQYVGRDGTRYQREVYCGVPQGSVLGPLLWNLAYDAVLRVDLPVGLHVVCYADDTLVLAGGDDFERTKGLAELGVACVVGKVHELGLRIAPQKTEALWFHKFPRGREPPSQSLRVGDVDVQVGRYLKYLGLTLDSRWDFGEHFGRSVPRILKVVGALHRLLPNLGGPREGVRRLYGGVVRSMALYGAPVWSQRLSGVGRYRLLFNSLQRSMAIRIVRGYRTISFEAATILARFPPLDILARMDARVYVRLRSDDGSGTAPAEVRVQERRRALVEWRERFDEPRSSRQRIVGAIAPNFEAWLGREFGHVTYRLTQVLTGHGCFGEYLSRIGREATPQCHHCGWDRDSAQHTLEQCSAWCEERGILVQRIGLDLSLPSVVEAMLADETAWKAVASFCETVLLQKEAAERDRERADPARRRRRRRGAANGRPALPAP